MTNKKKEIKKDKKDIDAKETDINHEEMINDDDSNKENQNKEQSMEEKLAEAQEQVLRTLADSENLRRRLEREKEDLGNYIVSNFAKEILSVVDNLQRAIKSIEDKKEDESAFDTFVEGIELTEKQLIASLEKFKIKKINTNNETFDPNLHQAMFEIEGKNSEAGKISEVIQDGYTIGDRLLRPAMVGVFKSKKS
jgi:molecular chaperone GrpE|tara:strand:+ start:639 stop:1223 length:585 start_codon:yes stop_codon:yes gene_type:complete